MPNQEKFNQWGLSIEAPKEKETPQAVTSYLMGLADIYLKYTGFLFISAIIHDKDINQEGELRRPHLHLYIETAEDNTLKAFLRDFCRLGEIEPNQVQIEGTYSPFLLVQYLTHKNNPNKAQYPYELIRTNNPDELDKRYNAEYIKPTSLLEDLAQAPTLISLIERVGVKTANQYRGLYKEIKMEQQNDIPSLHRKIGEISKDFSDLKRDANDLILIMEKHIPKDLLTKVFGNLIERIKSY